MEKADEQSAQSATARSRLGDVAIQQATAQIEASPFQVLYSLTGPQTIPNSGETKRVVIDQTDLDPALSVRATPKVEPKAYLYAKLTLPKTAPYLPGQVSLFRDSTFVGTGRLPALTPGQEFDLGFGADDAVRIRYANVDEKRSESGIISSSRNDARNFRIIMTNKHDRPIAITVFDQMPVSNNQEIKAEMTAKPQPTKRDLDDKRGVLAWEDTLKADEEKTIDFGYKITWPAAKQSGLSPFPSSNSSRLLRCLSLLVTSLSNVAPLVHVVGKRVILLLVRLGRFLLGLGLRSNREKELSAGALGVLRLLLLRCLLLLLH